MGKTKKPKMLVAVCFTVSAICSFMSTILITAGGKHGRAFVIFQLFTTALLIFCAAANWIQYTKQYIDYTVEQKLNESQKGVSDD